jgi:hypothetical protein
MIGNKVICQAPCDWEMQKIQGLQPPDSKVFFCNICGDIYARRIITPNTTWHTHHHACARHSTNRYQEPGGSIWVPYWELDYLKHLPKEVLHYEALLRIGLDK